MHRENASTRNVHRHAATAVRDCGVASGDGGVGGFASRRGLKAVCEREVLFTTTERQRNAYHEDRGNYEERRRGRESPEEEDRRREGTKKEKGEPRGCRFTSTSSRRGKRNTPPFVSLYLFSSPFYPCSVFLLFPSSSHLYILSSDCLSLATI